MTQWRFKTLKHVRDNLNSYKGRQTKSIKTFFKEIDPPKDNGTIFIIKINTPNEYKIILYKYILHIYNTYQGCKGVAGAATDALIILKKINKT